MRLLRPQSKPSKEDEDLLALFSSSDDDSDDDDGDDGDDDDDYDPTADQPAHDSEEAAEAAVTPGPELLKAAHVIDSHTFLA